VTKEEFIEDLSRLGSVEQRPQPTGQVLALLEAQPVPGTGLTSRVGFLLAETVTSRPPIYVEGTMRTRSGGVPSNWQTQAFGTDVLGTWSFNCVWDPASDPGDALALAALAQWNR